MSISIASVGLATAQGSKADILASAGLKSPATWPWPVNGWHTSKLCRPAQGIGSDISGINRWRRLVRSALEDCFDNEMPSPDTPLFLGTCNGSVDEFDTGSWNESFNSMNLLSDTPWSGRSVPVFSSSCNSGMHALYAARLCLQAGVIKQAVVVAADILSRSNQSNFDVLRVLTDSPAPWQSTSTGFILGDAAVALRLVKRQDDEPCDVVGPELNSELTSDDGLPRVLEALRDVHPKLLLGQGTGPVERDEAELGAYRRLLGTDIPLSTALHNFGHTLGASGLLSLALGFLIRCDPKAISALVMPKPYAIDGRRLLDNATNGLAAENILVICRALNGSCSAAALGADCQTGFRSRKPVWHSPVDVGALMHPTLRLIAAEALLNRPAECPDVLLVRLEFPLTPPADATIGGRLLPSAVLEMTPGFTSQLIARRWGFTGPALCVVGNETEGQYHLLTACDKLGLSLAQVNVLGTGDKRELEWNT